MNSFMRQLAWISLFLIALSVAGATDADRPTSIREILRSEENYDTVRFPNKVEIIALDIPGDVNKFRKFGTELFTAPDHAKLRSFLAALPTEKENMLSKKLLSDQTYYWEGVKGCAPLFHLRASFTRGENVVTADFCFGCDLVYFRRKETVLGSADFHPGRGELLSIFRQMFPANRILDEQAAEDARRETTATK